MRDTSDGDLFFGPELTAINRNLNAGWAVKNGCAVTPGGSTTVDIAAGSITYGSGSDIVNRDVGATFAPLAGELTLPDWRYDLIVVNSAGTVITIQGTVNKKAPDVPADRVLLAVVKIENGASVIGTADIYDARALMQWRPDILADTGTLSVDTTSGNNLKIGLKVIATGSGSVTFGTPLSINTGAYGGKIFVALQGGAVEWNYTVSGNAPSFVNIYNITSGTQTVNYTIMEVS